MYGFGLAAFLIQYAPVVGGFNATMGRQLFLSPTKPSIQRSEAKKQPWKGCRYDNFLKTTKCVRPDGSASVKKSVSLEKPNQLKQHNSSTQTKGELLFSVPQRDMSPCSIDLCGGVNLRAAILSDLAPWRDRGGITRADVDHAMSWKLLQDQRTKMVRREWIRVTIFRGNLFVKNLGAGYGTRDAVFLLMLLELLETRAGNVPDVDFVQYTFDRAFLKKDRSSAANSAAALPKHPLPFALSFARHPDYLDVGIPDSSFWGWPEVSVNPHWHLSASAQALTRWEDKASKLHWRGSPRRTGYLREALVGCAADFKQGNKGLPASWADVKMRSPGGSDWEHPLGLSKYKLALFIQGEGYTSSKQRTLASGSCPVFAELNGHDTFYGRWLKEGVHFKRIGVRPVPDGKQCTDFKSGAASAGGCAHCGDLGLVIRWAAENDHEAKACAHRASKFAASVFSRPMLLEYLLAVLQEVANLQKDYDIAAVVAGVHGGLQRSGESKDGGSTLVPPTPVTQSNLALLMRAASPAANATVSKKAWGSACSHDPAGLRATEVLCENAVRLGQWWLKAERATYEGKADPPCNPSLCHKCCKPPTGLTR